MSEDLPAGFYWLRLKQDERDERLDGPLWMPGHFDGKGWECWGRSVLAAEIQTVGQLIEKPA